MKAIGQKFIHAFLVAMLAAAPAFAQTPNVEEAPQPEEPVLKPENYRNKKFLSLTLGVEFEEKLGPMPNVITFKGDFRKIVKASYAKSINSLRFTPVAEGVATLTLHDSTGKAVAEYRLDVKKSKLDAVIREMQSLLGDIEGINIRVINGKVVVDGQVLLPRDLTRIFNVVKQFGDQASSLVALSPLAQKKISEFISRDINDPEIQVRAVNEKLVLEGFADSQEEKDRAETIAKMYVMAPFVESGTLESTGAEIKKIKASNDGVVNLIKIKEAAPAPAPKIIQLVVHYVELTKSYNKGFLFQFTPSLSPERRPSVEFGGSSSTPATVIGQISGIITNLLPKLNWAKSHGHARVLNSVSVIVQESKTGKLSSKTQVPYVTTTQNGPQTGFQEIGIETNITPTLVGEKDSIALNINFDIAAPAGTKSGALLVANNKITTDIVVRNGQSAAIGGLVKANSQTTYNDPSALPPDPIITLLASKDFNRQQSQFVVFVTPIIKASASDGSEAIKKKFRLRE